MNLYLLAFANFVVGMGAFVVIGVLTPVASSFGITRSAAGGLMSIYAIVYAVASPILVALTGKLDRARLLTISLGVFLVGTLMAALAGSFDALLLARVPMAIGGALVTPVAASVGISLLPPAQRGKALAVVFGGLTLAQAVGVPLGAWIGYAFGWRTAFWLVAAVTTVAGLALWMALPRGLSAQVTSLSSLKAALQSRLLMVAVSFTALFIGALYVFYTYLAPFLESRLGLGRDGVSAMLLVFGCGAVVGNAMGGWLTDRIGPARTLAGLALSQCLWLPLLSLSHLPVWATGLLIGVWSVCSWSFMVPQQARLAALSPTLAPVLFALNAAAIYVGSSFGAGLGGQVLGRMGFEALGLVGAGVALLAGASLYLAGARQPQVRA